MARIAGINIAPNKHAEIALTGIYGIGRVTARKICADSGVKPDTKIKDLTEAGWDLGGSGSNMRTPSCCVGPARCEWACYDTLDACYNITQEFQDELHRPFFPYKYKFKFAGCPNDCVASVARADMSIIGTWKDDIQIDQAAVKQAEADGVDDPLPGFVIGGPQDGGQDPQSCLVKFPSDLPALAYLDDVCSYATNEVAINWNAAFVYAAGGLDAILGNERPRTASGRVEP